MARFAATALLSFVLYLVLTTATGAVAIWNGIEIAIGVIFAILVAALTRNLIGENWERLLSPRRWLLFIIYFFGPFLWAMTVANFDVVYRVITGRIKPGIVRIAPNLKNDASVTLLANSITLTPGTLTVEVDEQSNDMYIHWINVDEKQLEKMPRDCEPVCGGFPKWARRIAE